MTSAISWSRWPIDHCALCEFRQICDERWEAEDHLTLQFSWDPTV